MIGTVATSESYDKLIAGYYARKGDYYYPEIIIYRREVEADVLVPSVFRVIRPRFISYAGSARTRGLNPLFTGSGA